MILKPVVIYADAFLAGYALALKKRLTGRSGGSLISKTQGKIKEIHAIFIYL